MNNEIERTRISRDRDFLLDRMSIDKTLPNYNILCDLLAICMILKSKHACCSQHFFVAEVHTKQNLADKTINFSVMLFLIIRSKLECQIHVHMQFS